MAFTRYPLAVPVESLSKPNFQSSILKSSPPLSCSATTTSVTSYFSASSITNSSIKWKQYENYSSSSEYICAFFARSLRLCPPYLLLPLKLASSASFPPSPRAPFSWRKPTTRNPHHFRSKFTIISNLLALKNSPNPSIFRPRNLNLSTSKSPIFFDSHPLSDLIDANITDNFQEFPNLQSISDGFITHQIAAPSSNHITERIFLPDPSWLESLFIRDFITEERSEFDLKEIEEKRKYYKLRRRQVRAETEAWERMTEEYREFEKGMCEKKLAPTLPYVKKLFSGWFQPLTEAIEKEQKVENVKKKMNVPQIDSLPADKMAIIVMYKMMGLLMMEQKPVKVVLAALQIATAIEHEVRIQSFLKKRSKKTIETMIGDQCHLDASEEIAKLRDRVKFLARRRRMREVQKIVQNKDNEPWSRETQAKLGCRLIELLIETAYIQPPVDQSADSPPDIRPAFRHTMRIMSWDSKKGVGKRYGVVECDSVVLAGLDGTAKHMVIPYVPMLVPPKKWKRYDKGGYLFLPSCVIRTHGSRVQEDAIKGTPVKQMQKIYKALDILGTTKWRVNKRVLSVVESIWDAGGNVAGIVDRGDVPIPKLDSEDSSEIKKWRWSVRKAKKINQEMHSQRSDIELKLSVARKLKDEEGFYYPHNIDFRGRAYPMHPHLNHLSSDLCRGVLEFAEGRPLGRSGLRWLKIQIANLYGGGVEKLSYEGRLAFVENHINDIVDSAENPLNGNRWWLTAEDPFQCLAACFNVLETLKSSSPQSVISHLPIHQDGSCNGLQHYAALGRDPVQAAAVNLVAGEKPADVYSEIAARVHDIMERDSKKDPASCCDALLAQVLTGQVTRKLVKQTVMTSVYGVTYIGAREQIKRRLEETGQITDDKLLFSAACYAAKVTLAALGELFREARATMRWLGECAKIIGTLNQPVRWTTPLGLPIVQPYFKAKRRIVKTTLQNLTLNFEGDYVMTRKQQSAFPPNFVHSLDGSHMMMTAIACRDAGLCFAGVHDSFWTHACDVDKMNEILREKFVELYSEPILEKLLESFQTAYPELKFPPLPERGNFDLKAVLRSPYFFN